MKCAPSTATRIGPHHCPKCTPARNSAPTPPWYYLSAYNWWINSTIDAMTNFYSVNGTAIDGVYIDAAGDGAVGLWDYQNLSPGKGHGAQSEPQGRGGGADGQGPGATAGDVHHRERCRDLAVRPAAEQVHGLVAVHTELGRARRRLRGAFWLVRIRQHTPATRPACSQSSCRWSTGRTRWTWLHMVNAHPTPR